MVERSGKVLSPGVPMPEWPYDEALVCRCPAQDCRWHGHADQADEVHVRRVLKRYDRHYRDSHLQGTMFEEPML